MKGKSIVAVALVGALTLGSSVFAFASTSSDINLDTQTTVSTSSDDTTTSDDTSSTCSKSHSNKHSDSDSSNHTNHRGSSVKSEISTLVDEGYTLEDAKATVLAEKLAEIDAKVTDGILTSEEADSLKEKITEKINNYTGEEASCEDTTDVTHKKHGSRGDKTSSSTDDTSSDTTATN